MSAQPHVHSYYATSVGPQPERAALAGTRRADVCVVGAGFTGLSTALNLAERGYDVVVLEANRVGWGASGRNGGQIGSTYPADMGWLLRRVGREDARYLFALSEEAKAIIRERVARHDISCDLKWGSFQAATKRRHLREIAATQTLWADEFGYQGLELAETGDAARHYVNSPSYVGGLYDPGAGQLQPLKYCLGLAAAAESAGATIHEGSSVIAVDDGGDISGAASGGAANGGKVIAKAPGGRVEADSLVLCGNAYLGDLVPEIRQFYVPLGSYIVATEPLGERLAAEVIPGDCSVFDSKHILDYYRLSADTRLLFGGRIETSPFREPDPRGVLGARIRRLFPQMAARITDAALEYAWGGTLAMTYTRMPQVGRLGSRVYFAQGYSGEGVAMSGLLGKVLAEAVAGQLERFDLFARLPHRVFPGGRLLQLPALAMGLLWYRLCDMVP